MPGNVALIAPDPTLFSTVGLAPATALLPPGGSHTVTATATSAGGAPVAGVTITFRVVTGPNTGVTGEATTNATGQAAFTYADAGGAGRDTFILDRGDGHVTIQDFTSGADRLKFIGFSKADIHTTAATEGGVAGLLVTYDAEGDSIFLAHVSNIGAGDMLFA